MRLIFGSLIEWVAFKLEVSRVAAQAILLGLMGAILALVDPSQVKAPEVMIFFGLSALVIVVSGFLEKGWFDKVE